MKVRIAMSDTGTVLVTRLEGMGGSPGSETVEVQPRGSFNGYRFRRLRKMAGTVQDLKEPELPLGDDVVPMAR